MLTGFSAGIDFGLVFIYRLIYDIQAPRRNLGRLVR